MRWACLGILVALTGCYRWAPVTSLYEVQDAQVTVQTDDMSLALQHATVKGRVLSGVATDGEQIDVELSHARIQAKRLNVATTAALVTSASVVGVASVIIPILMVVLTASRPIPTFDGGSGGSGGSSGSTR